MLDIELAESLPIDPTQECVGWEVVGETPEGKSLIEVCWAPRRNIAAYLGAVRQAGLDTICILPSLAPYRKLRSDTSQANGLLLASETGFECFQWAESGACRFSRGRMAPQSKALDGAPSLLSTTLRNTRPPQGTDDLARFATYAERGLLERLMQSEGNAIIQADVPDALKPHLGRFPDADPSVLLPILAAASAYSSAWSSKASGLALTSNMLPRDVLLCREKSRRKSVAVEAGALWIAALLLLVGNLWLYAHQMQSQLDANQREAARLKPIVEDVDGMRERISSIREQIDYVLSPIEAINLLNGVLADNPQRLAGLYLDKMQYDDSGLITLEGHATNDITPWEYAELLGGSDAFRIEHSPDLTFPQYGSTRAIRFRMTVAALGNGTPPSQAEGGRTP